MSSLKALALLVAQVAGQVTLGTTMINDPDRIARLNAEEGSLWHAAQQTVFDGMTFDDARFLLGAQLSPISKHLNETLPKSALRLSEGSLPDDFDASVHWQGLIHPIRNQMNCGSCWAFSASEVLSDRVAIASGKPSPVLSPQDLVSCDTSDYGCRGGYLDRAWKYLVNTGIATDSCFPYTAGNGHVQKCVSNCVDSKEKFTRTKAKNSYAINGAVDMQTDLLRRGPVQVAFEVYPSFMSYTSGVYHKHHHEDVQGGHAVKCVGWGVADGKPYWTMANSWGTLWGERGFFRILRGKDECGIESMGPPYAGEPAVAAAIPEAEIVV